MKKLLPTYLLQKSFKPPASVLNTAQCPSNTVHTHHIRLECGQLRIQVSVEHYVKSQQKRTRNYRLTHTFLSPVSLFASPLFKHVLFLSLLLPRSIHLSGQLAWKIVKLIKGEQKNNEKRQPRYSLTFVLFTPNIVEQTVLG